MKIKRLKLKKLNNTRDLGGIKTKDKKAIKPNMLYRSGRLYKLPKSTLSSLEGLKIKTIIDLRMKNEREEKPDTLPRFANYYICPLVCTATPGITYDNKVRKVMKAEGDRLIEMYQTPDNYMIQMYKHMLIDEQSVEALKRFFRILIDSDGAVLYHCSSGKDRIGVCTMLLLSLLGVEEKYIVEDYMASKVFCKNHFFLYKFGIFIGPLSGKFKRFLRCLMRIKKEYIIGVMDYIKETYGNVENFAIQKLGLTKVDIQKLKTKYLQ